MLTQPVFTKKQAVVVYRMDELIDGVQKGRIQLRHVNKSQTKHIRLYMLDNLGSGQVYLPPIVARIESGELVEGRPEKFVVIDGTQRLNAMAQLIPAITRLINSDDPESHKKGYLMNQMLNKIEIAVQIFEGFSESEADQLFIDLNTKGKKVSLSKRIAYDSRNEVNRTTNLLVGRHTALQEAGIEQEKISVMRPKNKNLLSLSQLRRLVGYFMTGQPVTSKLSMQSELVLNSEEHLEVISLWFDELFRLVPTPIIGNYEHSILASYTMLTALAEYAYAGLIDQSLAEKKDVMVDRMRALSEVEWNQSNEQWKAFNGSIRGKEQFFFFANDKATHNALVTWLRLKGGE